MFLTALVLVVLVGFASGNISGTNPPNGACLCVTAPAGLNIRGSACGARLGGSNNGQCFTYRGSNQWCTLGGTRYHFFDINYNGRSGWGAGNFLRRGSASECGSGPPPPAQCSGVELISRVRWGARPPRGNWPMRTPVRMVFVHHTVTGHCNSVASCSTQLRNMQRYHMNNLGWGDIGYSFLVGEDGRAYEGRGWSQIGAHTRGYNHNAIAISAIGNFEANQPNAAVQNAIRNLIQCGIQLGRVTSQHEVFGHRDAACTACPGRHLYARIQTWPTFSRRRIPRYC